jgi:hypothetical protein
MIEALVILALMGVGLLLLPLLLLKLALGLVLLPFKILGAVFQVVFGLLGAVFRVLFSGVGILLGLLAAVLFFVLLPLLPLFLLGLGIWVLVRTVRRPELARA